MNKKILMTLIFAVICVICITSISSCAKKNAEAKEYYNQAIEAVDEGNYIKADNLLKKALEVKKHMPKAEALKSKIEPDVQKTRRTNSINEQLEKARVYKDNGKYIEAYNKAQSAYSDALSYGYEELYNSARQLTTELLPLKEQQEAQKKAEKEAQEKAAKEKAEQEAKEKAEREAKEKAEREAKEAQEKAEREAREKAAAEEKARQEAEAAKKAKEEAEAREKAEAEEKARQEAAAKEKAEQEYLKYVESVADYIASCREADIYALERNPSAYLNKRIYVSGVVISHVTLERSRVDRLLEDLGIYETGDLEEVIIEADTGGEIAVMYSPKANNGIRLLEGDYAYVYGEYLGLTELTFTNIFGTRSSYKVPEMRGKYCTPE